jgi:hypothetical protein
MKGFVLIGKIAIVLVASLIAYRRCESRRDGKLESQASANAPKAEWIPTEAEMANGNRGGVGWVFGRMTGVAEAPGSLNHSPFRASPAGQRVRGMAPLRRW